MKIASRTELEQLLTIKDVAVSFQTTPRTIYRRMQDDPDFPKPLKLGWAIRFRRNAVAEYLDKKQGGRN